LNELTGKAAFQDSARSILVIKLTDPKKIKRARDLISGKSMSMPSISGKIVKNRAS